MVIKKINAPATLADANNSALFFLANLLNFLFDFL